MWYFVLGIWCWFSCLLMHFCVCFRFMIVEVVSVASYVLWMELYFVPVFVVLVNGSSVYCA